MRRVISLWIKSMSLLLNHSFPSRINSFFSRYLNVVFNYFVHLLRHHAEELRKLHCSISVLVKLIDQILQFVLGWVLSQGSHHSSQLLDGDISAPVLVILKERFFIVVNCIFWKKNNWTDYSHLTLIPPPAPTSIACGAPEDHLQHKVWKVLAYKIANLLPLGKWPLGT